MEKRENHTIENFNLRAAAVKGRGKFRKAQLGLSLLIGMACALNSIPVAAEPAAPDDLNITNIYAQRNLLETGDFLIIFEYAITYASLPTTAASSAYIFRLIDTDGVTELGAVTPYAYHDSGYNAGAASFYFDAGDAPTWGSAYTIRISGNPAVFTTSPPLENFAVASSAYTASTTKALNQSELATHVLSIANNLQDSWGTSYDFTDNGDSGIILYADGEDYFRTVIPGLQGMAPSLFDVQIGTVDYTSSNYTTTQADTYEDRLKSSWTYEAINAVADLFHQPFMTFNTFVIIAGIVALIILSVLYTEEKTPLPGFIAGIPIELCGGLLGMVSGQMIALISMGAAMYIGYWWFFQRS